MDNQSNTTHLKREVLVRLVKAYLNNDLDKSIDKIPYEMRPKNAEVPFRCCIHKERAILRQRAIASLGHAVEKDDEITMLTEYAQKAAERQKPDEDILTVVETACKGCVPSRVYVTDLCQGCVARPCISACSFGAIEMKNGKSYINGDKCKNCGKCTQVCPYSAIVKLKVPCEDACPVNAITKNETGHAEIDFDKCISCGACVGACPFAAVHEKSQIFDILKEIYKVCEASSESEHSGDKEAQPSYAGVVSEAQRRERTNSQSEFASRLQRSGKKVIAMVAPAIVGQLPVSVNKIAQGLIKVGFDEVIEVAQGADITARTEAKDFQERMERGDEFMTTSCCAAYNELVEKHVPALKPFRSETRTPMHYTAKLVKEKDPNAVTVFVGPCVAKRKEAQKDEYTDFVINFEEMGSLFVAFGLELSQLDDYEFSVKASKEGRNFAVTGGVAESVRVASKDLIEEMYPTTVDGLNTKSVREMKQWAKNGVCPLGNLVEVMACPGGCVGGSACLNNKRITTKKIHEYADASENINDLEKEELEAK